MNEQQQIDQFLENWTSAKNTPIIPRNKIAVGMVRHPQTGNWQVWLSLYGRDFTWFGAYLDQYGAASMIELFGELLNEGRLSTPEAVEEFLQTVKQTWQAQPTNVPDELFRKIQDQIKKDWKQ
jgi:hypothetical protein